MDNQNHIPLQILVIYLTNLGIWVDVNQVKQVDTHLNRR